jgi:hypothetical protein
VALHLDLLVHAGRQHLLLDHEAAAPAHVTRVDLAVFASRTVAVLADLLLVPLEVDRLAGVEVAQGDAEPDLDVLAAPLLAAVVAAAAEEAAEEVEGVVVLEAAALLVLLDAFVAVLVVDAAQLGVGEGLVGFRDGDELVLGRGVAGVLVRVELPGELLVGGFYLLFGCVFVDSEDLLFSLVLAETEGIRGTWSDVYLVVVLCAHHQVRKG